MALSNFPQTPADGDKYTNPDNGQEYVYDATDDSWSLSSAAGASSGGGGAPTFVTTATEDITSSSIVNFTATSTGATAWALVAYGTASSSSPPILRDVHIFKSINGVAGTGDTATVSIRNYSTSVTARAVSCTFAFYT